MTTETDEIKRLSSGSMVPLFFSMAVPIIISLLVAGLYNVVDGIYIAKGLGADAMAGVSMVLPLQMLMAASASLIGTGAASLMVRKIGAKDRVAASAIALAAFKMATMLGIAFMLLGLCYLDETLALLGVSKTLNPFASDYAIPILLGAMIGIVLQILGDIFRSEGKVKAMMMIILLASLLNMIFDPVFIFALEMGVRGAAVATVVAQTIALLMGVVIYHRSPMMITLQLSNRLPLKQYFYMLALGLPIFIAQLSMLSQIASINLSLQIFSPHISELWVAAYGIICRVSTFVFLPLIGMLVAFQTICGFNFGANQPRRVKQSVRVALVVMSGYATMMALLLLLLPRHVMSLFTDNSSVLSCAVDIVYFTLWSFPFTAIMMIAPGYYQAIGKVRHALFFSGLRVFFVFLPVLLVLHFSLGQKMAIPLLFMAIPVTDMLAVAFTLLYGMREYRRVVDKKKKPAPHAQGCEQTLLIE